MDPETVNEAAFRQTLGGFASGVTVVSARPDRGPALGFTVSSFASLSLDPPLISFGLGRANASFDPFQTCSHFAVSILAEDQAPLSHHFALAVEDKWAGIPQREGDNGCPLLLGACGTIECRRDADVEGGDHVLVIGRVLALTSDPARAPLLYHRGRYHGLGRGLDLFDDLLRD